MLFLSVHPIWIKLAVLLFCATATRRHDMGLKDFLWWVDLLWLCNADLFFCSVNKVHGSFYVCFYFFSSFHFTMQETSAVGKEIYKRWFWPSNTCLLASHVPKAMGETVVICPCVGERASVWVCESTHQSTLIQHLWPQQFVLRQNLHNFSRALQPTSELAPFLISWARLVCLGRLSYISSWWTTW